ncbi:MAG: hypothetical protein Q7W56_00090 [Candidatus Latescibacteria bacterium]|nr:hypothetical protein [Candidatus Latescibacterota bacterium]
MTRLRTDGRAVCLLLAALLAAAAVGCGVKITAPRAVGLFSTNAYTTDTLFVDANARQLVVAIGRLFVVGADGSLVKRTLDYEEHSRVDGFSNPVAVCTDEDARLVFVWEAGANRLSAFQTSDLSPVGSATLTTVQRVTHLHASKTGMTELAPDAETFLYLADPDSGVVHRFAWYAGGDMAPMGILCRDEGLSTRAVHVPAGMLSDETGMLLICDADTARNWVTRFDPTPDLTDVAATPEGPHPWRGLAVVFALEGCEPQPQSAYTLGDAQSCEDATWVGGPSDEPGEFDAPTALASDGQGRIFVADTGNDRVQIFSDRGEFEMTFRDTSRTSDPVAIGVVDVRIAGGGVNYGAYVFTLSGADGTVRRFISYDHYMSLNDEPPPPPN